MLVTPGSATGWYHVFEFLMTGPISKNLIHHDPSVSVHPHYKCMVNFLFQLCCIIINLRRDEIKNQTSKFKAQSVTVIAMANHYEVPSWFVILIVVVYVHFWSC